MEQQTTLARAVTYTGIGLHSGKDVTMTLNPAAAGTGIVFVRTDLPGRPRVAATVGQVTHTQRATTLEDGPAMVFTVEHLLAALYMLAVDNCEVELTSPEPPVGDGSALPFVRLIEEAGIELQQQERPILRVNKAYSVHDGDRFIAIIPYDGLRITFTSINPHPLLGVQFADFEITRELCLREIAPARTVAFLNEVEALQAQGLGLGGSMDNLIVYSDTEVLTPLRFPDELVRHKVLDCIGDLMLAGRLQGHVIAVKSGHALNNLLARKIIADKV